MNLSGPVLVFAADPCAGCCPPAASVAEALGRSSGKGRGVWRSARSSISRVPMRLAHIIPSAANTQRREKVLVCHRSCG